MSTNIRIPVLGFAAYSGTGKTTLLVKLLPLLAARGLRVGVIKHAHHDFDIDKPGKDSYELRKAGAGQMLVASSRRWALMVEKPDESEPQLDDLLSRLDQAALDLILVEGFKRETFPKIWLYRAEARHPAAYADYPSVVAVAADGPLPEIASVPVLDMNNPEQIADFVCDYVEQARAR